MTAKQQELWKSLVRRSFEPRQWFERDDLSDPQQEERTMWVYRKTENGVFTVGFYSPDKEWHSESDHPTMEEAAKRVHWLNGGGA